jgi:hypothetical protein
MYGELEGRVVDASGAVLPGVTVSLSGPAVMGIVTATTNDHGQYRFPAVSSGTYKLSFKLVGFGTVERDGIVVPVRSTVTVDSQLKVADVQEVITVTEASPVVDVENTKIGSRLDQATLQQVPTSRSIFGSATILPGMVMARQDPGGLNAATSTLMVAHGAQLYNLNYYGVTADTPQNYGSMYYMDFLSAGEISVDTAAMGAEVGGGGGANINIIPKSGSNQLRGELFYSGTGKGLAGNNLTPELRAQGITSPSSLQSLHDANAAVGGPLVKDRLWAFGSFRDYTTDENVPGFGTLDSQGVRQPELFHSNLRNYTASLKTQVSQNNTLSTFWTHNTKSQPHRNAGVNQPDPVSTLNQRSPKDLFNANWTSVLSQNTFLEISSSYFHMHWPSLFSDEFYGLSDSQKVSSSQDTTSGVFFAGPEPTGERLRDSYRAQTNIGLTRYQDGLLGGSHQFKLGFENWYGWGHDTFRIYNDTRLRYKEDAKGVPQPLEIFAYNTPLTQRTKMRNFAAFVQDRVSYSRLSLNLGLRWSYYDGELPEQTGGGGRWFAETTYPAVKAPYSWNTLAPRVGLVWKVTDDAKTAIKANYARYYDIMYTDEFSTINQNIIRTTGVATYTWFGDKNGNGIVDPGEFDPKAKSVFAPKSNTIDPNLRDPKTDEILFAVQRELASNVSFSASWIQRWFHDQTYDENIGIPTSAYIPHVFLDPGPDNIKGTGDDRNVTFYDVSSAYLGKDAFFHTNSAGVQRYRGLELTLTKRMSSHWQMMMSYVWSRLDGDRTLIDGRTALDWNDPNNLVSTMKTGRGANDQPQAFKMIGSFQAPLGINLGVNYEAITGLPRERLLAVALTQGTLNMAVDNRGTYRADFLNLLSVRGDKSIALGGSRKITLIAEVHNALNSHAGQNTYGLLTRSFANQAAFDAARATTSYFGRVQEIVAPRVVKLGAKLDF